MLLRRAFKTGLRLGFSLIILAALGAAAHAACLGTSRSVSVKTFSPHLGASPSGGIGLRHKEVVLTFDDGPKASTTPRVLAALRRECTKATFFVVGSMVRSNPSLLRKVRAAGHTIAHHTEHHANLASRSDAGIRSSITRGMNSVHNVVGRRGASRLFRYPYLSRSSRTDRVVKSLGLFPLSAAIDTLDWKGGDFVGRAMSQLARKGRGVILMHDIKGNTAKRLPDLLRRLRQGGYKVVHLRGGSSPNVESAPVAKAEPKAKRFASKRKRATKRDVARLENRRAAKRNVAKRKGFFARLRERREARALAALTTTKRTRSSRFANTTKTKRKSWLERMRERRLARMEARKLSRETRLASADTAKRKSRWSRLFRRKTNDALPGMRTFALALATVEAERDPLAAEAQLADDLKTAARTDAMLDFDPIAELQAALPDLTQADAEALLADASEVLDPR